MATCKQCISIFVFVFRSTYYPLVIGMFPPALRQFENQVEAEVAVEVAEFRSLFSLRSCSHIRYSRILDSDNVGISALV